MAEEVPLEVRAINSSKRKVKRRRAAPTDDDGAFFIIGLRFGTDHGEGY